MPSQEFIAERVQVIRPERSWGGSGAPLLRRVSANPALTTLSRSRKVLLLQGPVGPFYDRLTQWLRLRGAEVARVVFQGGDRFDCRALQPLEFTGSVESWPSFLRELLTRQSFDCLVLFGQSREYHKLALDVANQAGIAVVVFEEGYFRPGFITMELGGVNGYSTTTSQYVWKPIALAEPGSVVNGRSGGIGPDISPRHFAKMAWHAANHYAALHRGRNDFPAYTHHRATDPYYYAVYWLRSWSRKLRQARHDGSIQRRLFDSTDPYFFVPLQFDGDAQITQHSRYPENVHFIIEVMRSFAMHAPAAASLVFKQHPHARGGLSHTKLIGSLAEELGMSKRVLYLVEGDTPDLAQHAAGVVLINSTVGFQALERNTPLMVMGEAIYRQPHLTHNGSLDDFWGSPVRPDRAAVDSFLLQVKNLTQAPASVYATRDEPLNWLVHAE